MNVYNCRACREIGERPEMRVMRVAVAAENQYHFLLRSKTHTHHSSVHLLQYNSGHKGNDPLCTVSLLLSLLTKPIYYFNVDQTLGTTSNKLIALN